MREVTLDELHAPVYYGPVTSSMRDQYARVEMPHGQRIYVGKRTVLWRDAFGCEWMKTWFDRVSLGCRVLVPHTRANQRRDYGLFRLTRNMERGLRGIRDLMCYVESFLH